jgi:hypothetical protein
MTGIDRDDWPFFAVIVLLVVQMALFWLSLDAFMDISIFCTATNNFWLKFFGLIHFAYVILFVVGVASLSFKRARIPYIVLTVLASAALPAQAWLLANDYVYCDAP